MSEELNPTANQGAEAQKPAAPAAAPAEKPAAPAAAAKPAARPAVARPAAPAKPAVNELKPKTIEASALYAEMKRLHDEEGMDFLLNLTGEDWLEDGIGVVYQVENTENHKQACVNIKRIVPPMSNEIITLVKDTSLARTIAIVEIIRVGEDYITGAALFWPLFYTAVFYLVFCGILTLLFGAIEKKMSYFNS